MSFKDRIKRILKIALPVIAVLFIGYHMLFYTVGMWESDADYLSEKYDEYILFTVERIDWWGWIPDDLFSLKISMSDGYGEPEKNVVLFRWDANDLKEKMKGELRKELDTLKQQYSAVTEYTYDEDNFIVDVYMDKSKSEDYYDADDYVKDIDEKFSIMGFFCKRVSTSPPYEWYGEFNIHNIEREKEDVYAENDLKVLEEILSRSEQERPADLKDWRGAEWEEDEGVFHVTWLDLSDHDDITGELDLSEFTKLRYVCLENTKADKVILPESLKYIDQGAFRNCINLEEITIPKGVDRISRSIFWGCKNLKKVTFEGDAPEVEKGQGKVFGKVSEDLRIYHEKFMEGWQEKCWEDYDMVEILPRIIRQREGIRG